jgi:phosphogluconate dehydratase
MHPRNTEVTGRLAGASGKVPAAIHVTPEALDGGAIAKIRDGDMIRLDAKEGRLDVLVESGEWDRRSEESADLSGHAQGVGRELFAGFRRDVGPADQGALAIGVPTAP